MAKSRVSTKQLGGNDGYQWAVIVDGRVKWNGMTRSEARWRAQNERRAIGEAPTTERKGQRGMECCIVYPDGVVSDAELFDDLFTPQEAAAILAEKRRERGVRYPEIVVKVSGVDGNAFSILGRVTRGLKAAGVEQAECDAFMHEATRGDYDHLLQTVFAWVGTE